MNRIVVMSRIRILGISEMANLLSLDRERRDWKRRKCEGSGMLRLE